MSRVISSLLRLLILLTLMFCGILESQFNDLWRLLFIPITLGLAVLLSLLERDLLATALFFFLAYLTQILPFVNAGYFLIITLIVYYALVSFIKPLRGYKSWLRFGHFDKWTWLFIFVTVLTSSIALVVWFSLTHPDLSKLLALMPEGSILLLIGGAVLFATVNAIVEEFVIRGIMWDALTRLKLSVLVTLIVQAVYFGIMHYEGFPSGPSGMILAGIYGLMLGLIRIQSNGLGAPVVAHIFADLTIYIILCTITF